MNFQLKLNIEKLESLENQLIYVNEMITGNIKKWETKEYKLTKTVIENDITDIKKLIETIKSI